MTGHGSRNSAALAVRVLISRTFLTWPSHRLGTLGVVPFQGRSLARLCIGRFRTQDTEVTPSPTSSFRCPAALLRVVPAVLIALIACARSEDGTGCPAGHYDLGHTGHCDYACTPGPNAPADPIDPEFIDENCDGTDGVAAKCLFVASDGIDSPDAGSRQAPMKTVTFAIAQAKMRGSDVCLGAESLPGR